MEPSALTAKPLALALLMFIGGTAQAALHDRGGGLLYDDVLNITWLQDANYARTSGYDTDGRMTWSGANAWAASLSYGGYTDWRLATNAPQGSDWDILATNDGSTDRGYNITSTRNELSYMYYVNLGLVGKYSPLGVYQSNYGIFGNGTFGGQADVGLVRNFQSDYYWSEAYYLPGHFGFSWALDSREGAMGAYGVEFGEFYAWAVRSGDVRSPLPDSDYIGNVPEPETYAMLLAGLGLILARRARKVLA